MIPYLSLLDLNNSFNPELTEAVLKTVNSGWYLLGSECKSFEAEFSAYCGTKHCIGVANGLDALVLILKAYKELSVFVDGDEIVVPANTYIASILAISAAGLTPVLVEPQ